MIAFWICIACALGMALAQAIAPGAAVYHTGWYNALDIAFAVAAASSKRRVPLAAAGCAIAVVAAAACGLMAPDSHVVVGAPGASVRDDAIGATVVFPLDGSSVRVEHGSSSVAVGGGRRYWGAYVFWQQPREVVAVQAADARGNRLTITQPTNATFLSPVLLMQQTTAIAGMNVRFDSFSVPARNVNVKAMLFSADQTAQLHRAPVTPGAPAVLFDVLDRFDRPIPGGLGFVASGTRSTIAGLSLGAQVREYPALFVASAPYWPILLLGLIVCAAGVRNTLRTPVRAS